jgi:cyclase
MTLSTSINPSANEPLSRREFLRTAAGAVGAVGACGGFLWPSLGRAQQTGVEIRTTDLGGVKLLQGAGSNVLAMHGDDGALMVDGGLAANADALLRAVYAATGNDRVRLLIDTHWHKEQTGANEAVGAAGGEILAHEKTAMYLGETAYERDAEGKLVAVEPLPKAARPTKTIRGDGSLTFGGHRVDYGYLPQAHTDGDLYVHLTELNVLAAGGVVSAERWPLLDYRNGAWFGGRVRALEWLAKLVKPDTRVVPAQGRLLTGRDVVRQRQIYDELFETLIGYMNKGFGAEDCVASNPLKQYDAEFGDPSAFLDGAYRSMLIAYVPE